MLPVEMGETFSIISFALYLWHSQYFCVSLCVEIGKVEGLFHADHAQRAPLEARWNYTQDEGKESKVVYEGCAHLGLLMRGTDILPCPT